MGSEDSLNLAFSRPVSTAKSLGGQAPESDKFFEKKVLLIGDEAILATENGKLCFLNSIRLLVRFISHLTVSSPSDPRFRKETESLINTVKVVRAETKSLQEVDPRQYDAILSVGTTARKDLPWTVINSNGWLARVSSGGISLPSDCSLYNPVGALGAASLGASEIFKRLVALKPERGMFFDGLSFSLQT